jgi:hypothetical protein
MYGGDKTTVRYANFDEQLITPNLQQQQQQQQQQP